MARLLHVKPGIVVPTFKTFTETHPDYSAALDGYVDDAPSFMPKINGGRGPFVNFDHHRGVNRAATRSTCAQVYVAITQGFYDTFRRGGDYQVEIFLNDCDQDICLATWELMNPERLHRTRRQRNIDELVMAEDLLDSSGGSYPINEKYYNEPNFLHKLAWIFDPYTQARFKGSLFTMSGDDMGRLIEVVGGRITKYANGQAEEIEMDARYEVLRRGTNYVVIKEIGPFARRVLFSEEPEDAYVSIRENPDETRSVTIGKMSQYIIFPLELMADELNKAEGLQPHTDSCWGGGDTIIGSPRKTGTKLSAEEVCKIVEDAVISERKKLASH